MNYLQLMFADAMRRRATEMLYVDHKDESGIEFSDFASANFDNYLKEAILEAKRTADKIEAISIPAEP